MMAGRRSAVNGQPDGSGRQRSPSLSWQAAQAAGVASIAVMTENGPQADSKAEGDMTITIKPDSTGARPSQPPARPATGGHEGSV